MRKLRLRGTESRARDLSHKVAELGFKYDLPAQLAGSARGCSVEPMLVSLLLRGLLEAQNKEMAHLSPLHHSAVVQSLLVSSLLPALPETYIFPS